MSYDVVIYGKPMSVFHQSLYKLALSLGVRRRKAERLLGPTRFNESRKAWLNAGGKITKNYRILSDFGETAGTARGHYFHQDLLVADFIHKAAPKRHIDIGSRIDGFVAHIAAFRPIEVMDIRPLADTPHDNISFLEQDLMQTDSKTKTDSLSCLHAIEHFGLGRYGDPIDIDGHLKGFQNMADMLEPKGRLYISFPIADQDEVHFNAHRIFAPTSIFNWPGSDQFTLARFDYVGDDGNLYKDQNPATMPKGLKFGCGIYSFVKI